jgi:hypothetical protein
VTAAEHTPGERLLARWESLPGALRWVADVGADEAEAWLAGQMYAVADAAALADRLEPRMLAAVADSHVSGDSPEAHLRAEFAAARDFLEGRPDALLGVVSGALTGLWQRARVDAADVFDQLGLLLDGGSIETRGAAGKPVATTMVDREGDLRTVWTSGLPPWQVALHRQNVAVALRARAAALDGLAAAARGAARLTALIAAPASTAAVMTLPIAWRYLRRLWHMSG